MGRPIIPIPKKATRIAAIRNFRQDIVKWGVAGVGINNDKISFREPSKMNGNGKNPHRQQQLYWNQMVELKVASSYIRLYRDYLARWVTGLGTLRAVASSASIGAWVVWKQYAFIWAAIIVASQVADALKEVFPFSKKHKSASELTLALTSLFIDAQLEWENIFSGRYNNEEIMNRLHKLRKLQLEMEGKSFPEGLAKKTALFEEAQKSGMQYFATTYNVTIH
jgi:hypothetical protein